MKITHAFAALALSAALAAPALAQPETKLTMALEAETVRAAWCSAVLLEEAFWYDADDEWWDYYDTLSMVLEEIADDQMIAQGFGEPELAEIWESFDFAAMDLSDTDEPAFFEELDSCVDEFGHLATAPDAAPDAEGTAEPREIGADLEDLLWCGALLALEWSHMDEGEPYEVYYDQLLGALWDQALEEGAAAGFAEADLDPVLEINALQAEEVLDDDLEAYFAAIDACEEQFGHLAEAPGGS